MMDDLLLLTNWVDRFNVLYVLGVSLLTGLSVLTGCMVGFVFLWASERYGK